MTATRAELDELKSEVASLGDKVADLTRHVGDVAEQLADLVQREEKATLRAEMRAEILSELGMDEPTDLHARPVPEPSVVSPQPVLPAPAPSAAESRIDRIIGLVESRPYLMVGGLVLVLSTIFGSVGQLSELLPKLPLEAAEEQPLPEIVVPKPVGRTEPSDLP